MTFIIKYDSSKDEIESITEEMTTKLCPTVQSLSEYYSFDNIYRIGAIRGATLQKEYDLKEFERILVDYFGKGYDTEYMLESLRGED